ncbi:MAG: cytochrome c oxidase assembly protein [Gammaproteobacteria bacterium]
MHQKTISILGLVVIGMFGFGFAMIPLYNVICDAFGLNGKFTEIESGDYDVAAANKKVAEMIKHVDTSRDIKIEFIGTVNKNLPWDFYPMKKQITLHPGEIGEIKFYAKNRSKEDITGQAVPSLVPGLAVKYFTKMECFCFTQQTLKAGEEVEMLLKFVVNPKLPKRYTTLSLGYTFFDTNVNGKRVGPAKKISKTKPVSHETVAAVTN